MSEIRLIDANALKEKGIKWFIDERYYHPLDKSENMSESIFSSLIDNAPTVTNGTYEQGFRVGAYGRLDEIRPQGKWILKETDCDSGGNNRYECSKCHYTDVHADSAEVPYCWHCGSKMKGGAEC